MSSILLTTEAGDKVFLDKIVSIPVPTSTTLTLNLQLGSPITYTYPTATLATLAFQRLTQAIDSAVLANKSSVPLFTDPKTVPTLTTATPDSNITAGTLITFEGTLFSRNTRVFIGSTECFPVTFVSNNQITAPAPTLANNASYDLTIYNPDSGAYIHQPAAIVYGNTSLVWTSINPPTVALNTGGWSFTVTGSGFISNSVNALQFNDGAGHTAFASFSGSDSTLTLSDPGQIFTVAASYSLQFSTDGGVTWNDSGLSITAS